MMNMPNSKPVSGEAHSFLLRLMVQAGLEILPPNIRDEILSELAMRLDAKLTLAALEALPDDRVGEFKKLLVQKRTSSQISDFLNKNIVNIGEIYSLAFVDFEKQYLGR